MKFDFIISVDTETQEFTVTNKETGVSKTQPIKNKLAKDENPVPQLILEEGKYSLNNAAIELLEVVPGDRLNIMYDKDGSPVIGLSSSFGVPDSGNQFTKSHTVRYSGINNTRLSEFGKVFTLVTHPDKEKLFNLTTESPVKEIQRPVQATPEVEEPEDIDLNCLIDDLDSSGYEVHGLDFSLN